MNSPKSFATISVQLLFLTYLISFAISCSDDPVKPTDTTRPAAVTDLSIDGISGGVIQFSWTATGDDGKMGTAKYYDLRSAPDENTLENWGGARQQQGEPTPSKVGAHETMSLPDTFSVTTYFALRVSDDAANTSPMSNIVHVVP